MKGPLLGIEAVDLALAQECRRRATARSIWLRLWAWGVKSRHDVIGAAAWVVANIPQAAARFGRLDSRRCCLHRL